MRRLVYLLGSIAGLLGRAGPLQAADDPHIATAAAVSALQALSAAGEGRRLFLKLNCYGCHGMGAAGGMGPDIVGTELGDVTEKVLQGDGGGMPSYRSYVTTLDLNNIAAYLASIGTINEPKFKDWWVPVPPK
jgi:mono/diheme cytochrome c family protein